MIGKNKMKDWKACVHTWEQRDKKNSLQATTPPKKKEFKTVDEAWDYINKELTTESIMEAIYGLPKSMRPALRSKLQGDKYCLPLYDKARKIIEAQRRAKNHKNFDKM